MAIHVEHCVSQIKAYVQLGDALIGDGEHTQGQMCLENIHYDVLAVDRYWQAVD